MVESFRRLLWLVPLLTLGAAGLFSVFASTIAKPQESRGLFFNDAPRHAEHEALAALADLGASDPARVQRGEARLRALGGAGLPHVLSRLATLPVREQRLTANALWPVAERMALDDYGDLQARAAEGSPARAAESAAHLADQRLIFWQQYYDEHALDFRAPSVQRLVKRLSSRDLRLRRADLLAVDTYALPALVEELGRVRVPADIERVERLAEVISHMTERRFRLPASPTVEDARRLASEIRLFWDREGAVWTQMGRLEILAASIGQTEFALWLRSSFRQLAGIDSSQLGPRLWEGVRQSAPLFALSLLGTLFIGPGFAATVQVLQMRRFGAAGRNLPIRVGLSLGLCTLIPGGLFHAPNNPWLLGLLATLGGTLSSAYLLQRELADRVDWRTSQVLGRRTTPTRVRAVLQWLAPSVPTLAPLAVAEAALWVSCLELGAGKAGLGRETFAAVQSGDMAWLMMAGLSLGLLTGGMQLVSDALLGTARLRWREA